MAHACPPGAAGQQEGEQVAQVELVIDAGHQQDEQRGASMKPGRVGRMYTLRWVSVMVSDRGRRLPPALKALAYSRPRSVQGLPTGGAV